MKNVSIGIQKKMEQTGGNKNITTMKKFKLIYALLAVTLFVTACNDEELLNQGKVPAADGSEVLFGGRAGFENNDSKGRTIYSGKVYTYDGKDFERIDWITGDKIEIYSPQASNGSYAHYNITGFTTGDESDQDGTNKGSDYAYLERQGESSLQWNGDGEHTFYAMYPSSTMFNKVNEDGTVTTVQQGLKLDGSVVNGTVPTSQSGTVTEYPEKSGNYIITPNMNYAYMVAKTTAKRQEGQYVGLSFVPIVTAVEIEMIVPENTEENVHDVLIGEIQVTGKGIAGDFTADLTSTWTNGYPTCTNVGDGQGTIQISTWLDGQPLKLAEGKSVKFTVFMRPGADYSNLTIGYSPTGSGYIRKNLYGIDSNGNPTNAVVIPQNLKTRIKNLHLPATYDKPIEVDASRWMDQLADEVEFKALSIPGTGGTFSYNYSGNNADWYKQQTLTLDEQWKLGIRAFEIVSDRPRYGTESLGNEDVRCNKQTVGEKNVIGVLRDLINKVSTPNDNGEITETAVLILTYQPEGKIDWTIIIPNDRERNSTLYAESLNAMFADLEATEKEKIIQYSPTIKLGDARGKVMILCRINQNDENDGGSFDAAKNALTDTYAKNIVLINGCGTGKDRWGSRGYKVGTSEDNRVKAYDAANIDDATKSVDYWMQQSPQSYASNVFKTDMEFTFPTNASFSCWYQEWARVVDLKHLGINNANYYLNNGTYWYESYTEKLSAAVETFKMAISGEHNNLIFVNSLCGYLVDSNISASYEIFNGSNTGGIAGNIKALADKINVDFYKEVLLSGMEQTTGPTGIVMMDYAKNAPESETDGGYYLPGVIISNNFKGNLQTKPDGGTTGGGNTSGGSGSGEDVGGEVKP